MLFYVETGVRFTNDWGDMDEAFYPSVERTFYAALSRMKTGNLLDSFTKRVEKILADTRDIGWGFHYKLSDSYYEFYLGRPEDDADIKHRKTVI